jgi:heptosyltransferase-2
VENKIAADCRHFVGEKPCVFHKEHGVKCGDCSYYSPVRERILVIKMGAKGDVLRTTCILTGLKEKHPDSHITWVVEKGSQELLQNMKLTGQACLTPTEACDCKINLIDRVMDFSVETVTVLRAEKFDLILSLDSSVVSAALAEKLSASEKRGFGLSTEGKIYPFNPEAEEWFKMGVFDDVKRRNRKTYQEIALEICGIGSMNRTAAGNYEIIVNLTDEEKEFARFFAEKHGIAGSSPVIGLNTGAGGRWHLKKWTREGYLELIGKLHEELAAKVLLFGGEEEKERNQWLREKSRYPVIDTGWGNSLREFLALLSLCDLVVAGDTLAVHAAVGLKKKIIVLFGPTSASEIELYGRGEKVVAPIDCAGCYRQSCDCKPTCMDLITVESVFEAISRLFQ